MKDIAWQPSNADLESLLINNSRLDRLDAYLSRFNPIRIMRMEGMEVRHSNILGWLLDPLETHGLGDRFLKAFLSEALKGESDKGRPTALDIAQADLRDIEVRREWQHIDIFLLSRRNNWAFIIENKFHSAQHRGQLAKYVQKVRSAFEAEDGELKVKGVFLTLYDEDPEDITYASIGYDAVCELLTRVMAVEGQSLGSNVRIFLDHYIEVLKEATGMSEDHEEMTHLARALYRQHRKVLDFIWEHGASTNFSLARDGVFGEKWGDGEIVKAGKHSFVSLWSSGEQFSFLPLSWYEALGEDGYTWPGCEKWWSGFPVICWMQILQGGTGSEGSIRLFAEVGPLSDVDGRKDLVQAIEAAGTKSGNTVIRFQRTAANEGKKYSKFLKDNVIAINDVQDIEEMGRAIQDLLRKFQPCFDVVGPVLGPFTQYAEESDE